MQLLTLLQESLDEAVASPLLHMLAAQPAVFINALAIDSRQVSDNSLFFALKGSGDDARLVSFIQSAIDKGAVAILTDTVLPLSLMATLPSAVPVLYLPNLAKEIGHIASFFYRHQDDLCARSLRVAAVTGTNGKTTVTRLLAELLSLSQYKAAVMGTTGNGILPHLTPSTHTTLDALHLQSMLHQFAQHGAQFAALEASSHGLDQGRLVGTPIEVAIFTNLTRDHLDYHGTLEAYTAAKARLFSFSSLTHAIVNADDVANVQMTASLPSHVILWRYSQVDSAADFYVNSASFNLSGAQLNIQTPLGAIELQSPLLGRFNVSNLLAAIAGGVAFGLTLAQIKAAVPYLVGAPGRMQVLQDAGRLFVVDYAHTPDALSQVLSALRPHVMGQLTCVFGCGGNRDTGKRPLMTKVALELADNVVVTADNPRFEAVDTIIEQMLAGVIESARTRLYIEPDRRLAIRYAIRESHAGDVVVIAGKGHEDYQEVEGIRHWFDDVVEVKSALLGEVFPVQDKNAKTAI